MAKRNQSCALPDDDPIMLGLQGFELDPGAARKLERALKKDPSDMRARLQLLTYHNRYSYTSKLIAQKHLADVIWMIENVPDHPTLRTPWASIDKTRNPAGYESCKRLWLKQIRQAGSNVAIIRNAAWFLRANERLAERLHLQAISIKPNDSSLYRDLACLLRRGAPKRSARLKRALDAQQKAMAKQRDPQMKRYLLDDLAEIAFDLGEWKIARAAAEKSLAQAEKYHDWYTGNAIHDGNTVLGRLALREGDENKAIAHLKQASKIPGSPQLNSFGPNMILAQELMQLGHRKAVVSYLKGCKRFWDGESTRLDACIQALERGETPKLPRMR